MITLRFRSSDGTIPYVRALAVLLEYSRYSTSDFDFGPLGLEAITAQGLTVSGHDLELPRRLLQQIQGLHPSDE